MAGETVRIVARFTARADKAAEVKSILLGLVGETRKEKGRISYHLLQNKNDPGDCTFVEEWTMDSAFDTHLKTPHVQEALSRAQSLFAAEPDIRRYNIIA